MIVTEKQVEDALEVLSETEDEFSQMKSQSTIFDYKIKVIEASEYLSVENGTQEYKKSCARASKRYEDAVEEHEHVLERFTLLQSKRKTAETLISVWQSQQKSKSQGLL